MSYFQQAHGLIRYVLAEGDEPGLRKSQIGALHMISGHFTLEERAAVVVLPTGAGKTAVLMLSPYVLRANRVLVITQSAFVRDQITRDYKDLRTLRLAKALPDDLDPPRIHENKRTVRSEADWEALREYDVVIATPKTVSPAEQGVPEPPADLFDLVLIDEAHHSVARTWAALLRSFAPARAILFTATPFRRDRKEIRGKYVYTYPIQRAYEDGIYGEMLYLPVESGEDGSPPDVALARDTERVFREDAAAGLQHVLMVRADSRRRADELETIYAEETSLRLEVVHSGKTQRQAERIVQRLRDGELDGVICVNMLGEGFDLPNLKIAALHSPHRSLAVTLQFFGRFARMNGEGLGDAKFLAVPSQIDEDLDEVFKDVEAWGRHIRTVGQARIGEEVETREFLEDLQPSPEVPEDASLEDLSLYSFSVFNHVKVFQVYGEVDLRAVPVVRGYRTAKNWIGDQQPVSAFLLREEARPKWATTDGLDRVEYHLVVVYFDEKAKLLFINSTEREESIYREIAENFVLGQVVPLSLSKINRALRSYQNLKLFNVGMRNRATGTVAETYRQIAGTRADLAIDKSHGALYHRGHVFGGGATSGGETTIGLSSLSKVWRLESTKIPGLVRWCASLARDIENPAPFTTGIQLDYLGAGHDVTELPDVPVLGADWHMATYAKPPVLYVTGVDGQERSLNLLDVDLVLDRAASGRDRLSIELLCEEGSTRLEFRLSPYPQLVYANDEQPRWEVERSRKRLDLVKYLQDHLLRFHLADGSVIEGSQHFPPPADEFLFDSGLLMEAVDWEGEGVDIRREFGNCTPLRSVQDWLATRLVAGEAAVVFFDHRSGECADFLAVEVEEDGKPAVKLYHCKGAGGEPSGERVEDLYDVCCQATKSARWRNKKRLVEHVERRLRSGSRFLKGDRAEFIELMNSFPGLEFPLEVFVVQPGVSIKELQPKLDGQLSTTSQGLISLGCQRLRVLCSA